MKGISSKLTSFCKFVQDNDLSVICVTESHLTSAISSSFVKLPHFNLFRNDVQGRVHKHGVCAYVHEGILVDCVTSPMRNVLMFRLVKQDVFILVVYRPPSYTVSENEELVHVLHEQVLGKEVIIVGDFNLPNIQWKSVEELPTDHVPPLESMFLDVFSLSGLTQWVVEPSFPSSGNTLDLLLTSEEDRVGKVLLSPPLPACDHCPVLFDYIFQGDLTELQPQTYQKYAWHKGNYAKLNELNDSVDWNFEFTYLSASSAFDRFVCILSYHVSQCVPLQKPHKDKPPWRTNPPRGLIRHRQEAWARYKRARVQCGRKSVAALEAFSAFASVNKCVHNFEARSQATYENSLIDRFRENPKLLHSYVRSKKSFPTSVGPLKLPSGELCSDPQAMSKHLASSFASVFSKEVPNSQEPHQTFDGHIAPFNLTVEMVQEQLKSLDTNSAMGPDGIHPMVLKECSNSLMYPLFTIFSKSLGDGVVPKAWKSSAIIPIFKKGHRFEPLNYRPVSLTPVCCKSLERIITHHLLAYLEENGLLSEHQFGFRQGMSTMEQLLLVYNDIAASVDAGKIVDLVLFDYSKAFDIVCHKVLLTKLHAIGIEGKILNWINSFLSDREMRVSVRGCFSSARSVHSGVPQGSVIGPLLFLIYINHIGSQLKSKYKIFADDLKLYSCVKLYPHDRCPTADPLIQNDIKVLNFTSNSWGLKINREKCAVLRFSRNFKDLVPPSYSLENRPIPVCKSHGDLGVTVDTELKFHEHIGTAAHKASGLCHSFLKSTVCRSPDFMLFLLKTHIRPLIEYASCVWNTGYRTDLLKLERVQRMWTKQIDNMQDLTYEERLSELELFSVQGRLLRADLIMYWKIFHGKSCIKPEMVFAQPRRSSTRGHCYKIHVPRVALDVCQRSFSNRCISIWNSLPGCVVTAPALTSFKRGLVNAIGEKLYQHV